MLMTIFSKPSIEVFPINSSIGTNQKTSFVILNPIFALSPYPTSTYTKDVWNDNPFNPSFHHLSPYLTSTYGMTFPSPVAIRKNRMGNHTTIKRSSSSEPTRYPTNNPPGIHHIQFGNPSKRSVTLRPIKSIPNLTGTEHDKKE